MKKKLIPLLTICISTMHSQNINPRINSSGLASNQINYIVGVINVDLKYTVSNKNNDQIIDSVRSEIVEENLKKDNLTYYPNPTNDKVFISCPIPEMEFEVYNEISQLLVRQKLIDNCIDFSPFVKGVYLIVPISVDYKPFKVIKN